MDLHIRSCRHCDNFALRMEGFSLWGRWCKVGDIEKLRESHKIISEEEGICENCARQLQAAARSTH